MTGISAKITELRKVFAQFRGLDRLPPGRAVFPLLGRLLTILSREPARIRPPDSSGAPGGLIYLPDNLPTVVLPDIHGRRGLIQAALSHEIEPGLTVLEALTRNRAQLVCVGDYFHGEGRVRMRWNAAMEEHLNGYATHEAMDEEMTESIMALMMVALLKVALPGVTHLLKGNHENVANQSDGGNYPFMKFANEGAMVYDYLMLTFGAGVLTQLFQVEKALPLLTVGPKFLISHAEPLRLFERAEVIDYRRNEEVVYGLTWTGNGEAEPDSVQRMLRHYLSEDAIDQVRYFGGHRPVVGRYRLRAGGKYVQFHNPDRYVVAVLPADRAPEPSRDIIDLGPNEDAVDGTIAG